ncbi:MAG: universal stress protein [Chloroflexi bacterium]|nr:universal stress protein [Chloroflexota bacterium]
MRVLIATAGAPHSDIAVKLGSWLAEATGSQTTTVLTVIRRESERAQAKAILARAVEMMGPGAGTIRTTIRVGGPAEQIVREAEQGDYNLIVLGDRLHHGLAARLLAPTAERVIAQKPCPVLIAREPIRPLHSLLVCESGREPTVLTRLLEQLMPLVKIAEELTVLHVMSQIAAGPGVGSWELHADAETLIEKETREGRLLELNLLTLQNLNVRPRATVRHGLVVNEILTEAHSGDYDLLVLGAHQVAGWERFLLDDLAKQIIHQAHRSVLIV